MFPFDDVIMNVSQYVTIQYHSVFSEKRPDSDISSSSDALTQIYFPTCKYSNSLVWHGNIAMVALCF